MRFVPHAIVCSLKGSFENSSSYSAKMSLSPLTKNKADFRCFDCDTTRRIKWSLANHVQDHLIKTRSKSLQCELCDKYFTPIEMSSHMNRHPNIEDTLKCDKCDFACKTRNTLSVHMQLVHCHYQCDGCDYVARTWSFLNIHNLKKHIQERVYIECGECYLVYSTKKSLEYHVISKHPTLSSRDLISYKTDLKCSVCGEVQVDFRALRRHMYTHGKHKNGVGLMECKLCLLFYSSEREFKKHALVEHPEACDQDAYDIRNEIRCSLCDKKYSHIEYINLHIRKHKHFREKQNSLGFIICNVCQLCYANEKYSKLHLAKVHPGARWQNIYRRQETLTCSTCDVTLNSIRTFNTHASIHIRDKKERRSYIRCRSCNLYFTLKNKLETHVKKEHSESSPEELIEYAEELKCSICGEVRTDTQGINGHMRRVHFSKKKYYKSIIE